MILTACSLTEVMSSAVVIAMQSQLKDYAPTGNGAQHNRECVWILALIPSDLEPLSAKLITFN